MPGLATWLEPQDLENSLGIGSQDRLVLLIPPSWVLGLLPSAKSGCQDR